MHLLISRLSFVVESTQILAPVLHLNFLGQSLSFAMVYIWGRRNPWARMNFLGVFNFTAPYLPYVEGKCIMSYFDLGLELFFKLFEFQLEFILIRWVLLGFSVMLGSNGVVDLLGIFVGHVYYFLEGMLY